MMVVALRLIPGKYNKGHLLDLCTRLIEGHTVKHVTGSGQKPPVQRRSWSISILSIPNIIEYVFLPCIFYVYDFNFACYP